MSQEDSILRHLSGDALDEAAELVRLQRVTRPRLSDPDRIRLVLRAFGWEKDSRNASILQLYVTAQLPGHSSTTPPPEPVA